MMLILRLLTVAALAFVAQPARAEPLDALTCAQLGSEQEALRRAGVEQDMAKGHEWARANLTQNDLNVIRRFIEVSERLRFRCANLAPTRPEVNAAATALGSAANVAPTGLLPPPPLPQRRTLPTVKPAVKPAAPGAPAKSAPAAAEPAKSAARPKPGES
ncbi:MAG: hypothetical protein NW215_08075 [Hyphomicrobiales bacterium]|nr:hypothetical protein [Hyphomicrobiales bacterium]